MTTPTSKKASHAEVDRALFELYCRERGFDLERDGDDYAWVCDKWAIWQAARSVSRTRPSIDDYYKVPFRQVYCETIWGWLASVWRCHVIYRLRPPVMPR